MRHRLYYHLIWTTRGREPVLTLERARMLARLFRSAAQRERARILEIGMVSTHVHLLMALHPSTQIARLVQQMKGSGSYVASRDPTLGPPFRWAKGYTIITVSPRAVDRVREYLRAQPQRHPNEAIPGWEDLDARFEHLRPDQ